jgi:uncharacterized protein involved in propanediol utilization
MELARPPFPTGRPGAAPALPRGRTPGLGGAASATFGELVQGREPGEDNDFLVTLPITIESTARFHPFSDSRQLYVFPRGKTKSLRAARLFLERYGLPPGGILCVESGVAEGKGLASSSADLVATLRALANRFGVEMETEEMLDIIRQIEPTDGVMYEEAVAFFHRRVELRHVIGRLPRLCILAIDEGGTIDTISYNRQRFEFDGEEMNSYADILEGVTQAIRERRVRDIGRYATASTRLHQKRNFKSSFEKLERIMENHDADGIVNCHSGTFIGLCFDMSAPDALENLRRASECMERELGRDVHRFFSK